MRSASTPVRSCRDHRPAFGIAGRVDADATIAALPDPLVGQRLIGNAADSNMMQAALGAVGVNPLVVGAFRDRSERDAASAAGAE